jgi:Tfp pilus assembly protein PilW
MTRLASETAYSLTEVCIASALGGLLVTGMLELYLTANSASLIQNAKAEMQAGARAAMDIMARDLRQTYGAPTITTTLSPGDTISFDRLEDSGFATGGSAAFTLTDTRKTWAPGAWAPSSGRTYTVRLIEGTGAGQAIPISGSTDTELSLSSAWDVIPDTSSLYVITRSRTYTRTADNMVRLGAGGGPGTSLAANITTLLFTQPAPNTIGVTLAARTGVQDPRTRDYVYSTMTETVLKRN